VSHRNAGRLIPWTEESKRAQKKSSHVHLSAFAKISICVFLCLCACMASLSGRAAHAHGFNANRIKITRLVTGKYRLIIKYTHVEIGEYREAHVDFDDKEEAARVYQQLVQGADFFLGDIRKTIHFHTPPQKNAPY